MIRKKNCCRFTVDGNVVTCVKQDVMLETMLFVQFVVVCTKPLELQSVVASVAKPQLAVFAICTDLR